MCILPGNCSECIVLFLFYSTFSIHKLLLLCFKIDDQRRTHNYDEFICTFISMLAQEGKWLGCCSFPQSQIWCNNHSFYVSLFNCKLAGFITCLSVLYRHVGQSRRAKHFCSPSAGSEHRPPAQTEEAWPQETLPTLQSQEAVIANNPNLCM